jgi:hypothetical protein
MSSRDERIARLETRAAALLTLVPQPFRSVVKPLITELLALLRELNEANR